MLQTINPETKTHRLLQAFKEGKTFTQKQAELSFGIKNLSAEVSRVRQAGFAVYANPTKTGTGDKVTVYRMGKPSREIVAAGYRALAAERLA
jgi:hypothetical protein